ncbi:hypothetical protein Glove_328g20 [Diversispora epigaea]|uniref:Uncharacterized protein n=1 Tax=Diversispora epigaea TaxID=1348612 RepID=A0A397HL74_9GLOM|nr:hypothetical protein Glove_328g20 [Diversispora epigaea]
MKKGSSQQQVSCEGINAEETYGCDRRKLSSGKLPYSLADITSNCENYENCEKRITIPTIRYYVV